MTCETCGFDKQAALKQINNLHKVIEYWQKKADQYRTTWLKKVSECDKCGGPYGHCSCD